MGSVVITFVGLCLFVQYTGVTGRTVVIPDLSASTSVMTPRGPTCVEPHTAYVEANEADVKQCDACEVVEVEKCPKCPAETMMRLHLNGDHLTIVGITDSPYSEATGYNTEIPSITKSCPRFRLVKTLPPTATTLQINEGT